MFFIFAINSKREDLGSFSGSHCKVCGRGETYQAFVTYQVFSIFFLPIIKWDRKYYLRSKCCGSIFELDTDLGRDLEAGRKTDISAADLKLVSTSYRQTKTCPACGYQADPSFEYCPKCGTSL